MWHVSKSLFNIENVYLQGMKNKFNFTMNSFLFTIVKSMYIKKEIVIEMPTEKSSCYGLFSNANNHREFCK